MQTDENPAKKLVKKLHSDFGSRTYASVKVDNFGECVIIEAGSGNVALENQRYGRNKSTLVNKTYIDSGEYRRKFDNATDNSEVNKALYDCAKQALKHRSGTELEDMYWIDGSTGEVFYSVADSIVKRTIVYSDNIKRAIKGKENIITIHTHPSSMPPSVEDFNSCFLNGYAMGFVACHNGKVFKYSSKGEISKTLYDLYIDEYMNQGLDEFNSQIKALEMIKKNYPIDFEEVLYNG